MSAGEPELDPGETRIVHADEWLAVVDKPAGLIVHPAPGHQGPSLVEVLGDLLAGGADPERPGIVHRLDLDTSGLLIVARSQEAHAALSRMIAERRVGRTYTALVDGVPGSRSGKIDAVLGRDHRNPARIVVGGRRSRDAVTHFEVLERVGRDSLLEIRLETGRTHQIRAHMEAIGHPVCGDPVYAGSGSSGRYGLERQFLHASALRLTHPGSGEEVSFSSPLPADLEAALALARAGEGR